MANLTRQDGIDFLALARTSPCGQRWRCSALDDANEAPARLRTGRLTDAAVLVPRLPTPTPALCAPAATSCMVPRPASVGYWGQFFMRPLCAARVIRMEILCAVSRRCGAQIPF